LKKSDINGLRKGKRRKFSKTFIMQRLLEVFFMYANLKFSGWSYVYFQTTKDLLWYFIDDYELRRNLEVDEELENDHKEENVNE